jgi:hypothetical protein
MTNLLAQNNINVPGFGTLTGPSTLRPEFTNLGSLTSGVLGVVFTLAAFIAFFYMIWGALSYLLAGGDKTKIGKARDKIMWAVVGLLVLSITFALAQFIQQVLLPGFTTPISFVPTAYAAEENLQSIYAFGRYNSLGDLIAVLTPVIFSIAAIIVVLYFLYAAFLYISAGGGKDNIAKAQQMITHSIIGFVLLMMVYIIFQYILQFFGLKFLIF